MFSNTEKYYKLILFCLIESFGECLKVIETEGDLRMHLRYKNVS